MSDKSHSPAYSSRSVVRRRGQGMETILKKVSYYLRRGRSDDVAANVPPEAETRQGGDMNLEEKNTTDPSPRYMTRKRKAELGANDETTDEGAAEVTQGGVGDNKAKADDTRAPPTKKAKAPHVGIGDKTTLGMGPRGMATRSKQTKKTPAIDEELRPSQAKKNAPGGNMVETHVEMGTRRSTRSNTKKAPAIAAELRPSKPKKNAPAASMGETPPVGRATRMSTRSTKKKAPAIEEELHTSQAENSTTDDVGKTMPIDDSGKEFADGQVGITGRRYPTRASTKALAGGKIMDDAADDSSVSDVSIAIAMVVGDDTETESDECDVVTAEVVDESDCEGDGGDDDDTVNLEQDGEPGGGSDIDGGDGSEATVDGEAGNDDTVNLEQDGEHGGGGDIDGGDGSVRDNIRASDDSAQVVPKKRKLLTIEGAQPGLLYIPCSACDHIRQVEAAFMGNLTSKRVNKIDLVDLQTTPPKEFRYQNSFKKMRGHMRSDHGMDSASMEPFFKGLRKDKKLKMGDSSGNSRQTTVKDMKPGFVYLHCCKCDHVREVESLFQRKLKRGSRGGFVDQLNACPPKFRCQNSFKRMKTHLKAQHGLHEKDLPTFFWRTYNNKALKGRR